MDIYYPMATTGRHNDIAMSLTGSIFDLKRKREVRAYQEQCALVYYGSMKIKNDFYLVDTTDLDDIDDFIENVILELDYVQPDFILFKNNPYIENKKRTRIAGQPDLVVEVWSRNNKKNERAFLQNLYATSAVTEHWYIEQDSNEVICYLGKERLENQCLTKVLVTRGGLEFDLRYLAL